MFIIWFDKSLKFPLTQNNVNILHSSTTKAELAWWIISLSLSRLLSGRGAYDGAGTTGVDAHTYPIKIDYWMGS